MIGIAVRFCNTIYPTHSVYSVSSIFVLLVSSLGSYFAVKCQVTLEKNVLGFFRILQETHAQENPTKHRQSEVK